MAKRGLAGRWGAAVGAWGAVFGAAMAAGMVSFRGDLWF
ncbi:hypothetical protein BH20ACT5_BH20ACT5_05290 [soil metagenome]